VLGRRALVDEATWIIALVSLAVLWRMQWIPEPALIVAAGLVCFLLPR
jgi:hypothetical protein